MSFVVNVFAGSYTVQQDGSMRFAWQRYEECWIYAIPQNPIAIYVYDNSSNNATLDPNGWGLVQNTKYYSFYPFINNPTSFDKPTVSYTPQQQTANNSTAHLGDYDFMTAQSMSTTSVLHFDYTHLGSIIKFECTLPEAKTLNALKLSAANDIFTATAAMNVMQGMLTPITKSSSITLKLNNIYVGSGEKLIAYMMLPTTDFSGVTLSATLTATDGTTSVAKIKGTNVFSGHVYPIALEMPTFDSPKAKGQSIYARESGFYATQSPRSSFITAVLPQRPTATVPDFVVDTEHVFEQTYALSEEEIATSITDVNEIMPTTTYTVGGIKTSTQRKGTIYVSNGKKYIK